MKTRNNSQSLQAARIERLLYGVQRLQDRESRLREQFAALVAAWAPDDGKDIPLTRRLKHDCKRVHYIRHGYLTAILRDIFLKAGKPLTITEVLKALELNRLKLRAHEPEKSLRVKLYTDPNFKRVGRGSFVLAESQ